MIASFADLQRLSGYSRPSRVKRWLAENGVTFFVGKDGRPSALLDALRHTGAPSWEPDYAAALKGPRKARSLLPRSQEQVGAADARRGRGSRALSRPVQSHQREARHD
ncbi:MAG: DUF4224 domain-containing protein [Gammaproteobacteria bacterium]|nr:DUF4224 domain-containing protein [Gammaproteobacteria bacterium]